MVEARIRRGRRRKRGGGVLLVIVVLALVYGVAVYALFVSLIMPETSSTVIDVQYEHLQAMAGRGQYLNNVVDFALTRMVIESINDTGYLALINRDHAVLSETGAELLVPAWPTVPVSFVGGMYLHPTALQAVADMINTARSVDVGPFFVSSGFRCPDIQAVLYGNGLNSTFALPPGHSEHHTGLAIDILAVGISQEQMGSSREGRWLADNGYRYGLILRYPQGATSITGIEFEPWHFRYVGRPHAYYMKHNGLVLEEYIALIQSTGGFSFEMSGITYYVLHQTPRDGMIYLPTYLEFTVSNDNMGGFIVTALR